MSFACRGITHCANCGTALSDSECFLCDRCAEEERKAEEEYERKRELESQKKIIKAELIEEVRDDVKNDLMKDLLETKYSNPIKTIGIDCIKPKDISFDDWYADIGYKIISEYQQGQKELLIEFKKENENECN